MKNRLLFDRRGGAVVLIAQRKRVLVPPPLDFQGVSR